MFPIFLIATPNVGAIDGGIDIILSGKFIKPKIIPTITVATIPINIAILDPLTINIAITIRPNTESNTVGFVKSQDLQMLIHLPQLFQHSLIQ